MAKTQLGPLIGQLHKLYGQRILEEGIVSQSETEIVFLIKTEVGPFGFQIEGFQEAGAWTVLRMSISPMYLTANNTLGVYDLCKIDIAQYEHFNRVLSKLEWASLFLSDEDGSKYPVFSRNEVLDSSRSFDEQDFDRIISALQLLELDAVAVVPVLAALSSGVEIAPEAIALMVQDVKVQVQ